MLGVLMAMSDIALPHPPLGSPTIRSIETYTTSRMVSATGENARNPRWANFVWSHIHEQALPVSMCSKDPTLDCVPSDLPKPDLLHTMQLGMLKHLLWWLSDFLKQYKRLEVFNNIWISVPAYLDMSPPLRGSFQLEGQGDQNHVTLPYRRLAQRSVSPNGLTAYCFQPGNRMQSCSCGVLFLFTIRIPQRGNVEPYAQCSAELSPVQGCLSPIPGWQKGHAGG